MLIGFANLTLACFIKCSGLSAYEVGTAMCVSKEWKAVFGDEIIWEQLLVDIWGLTLPCDVSLRPVPSSR